ncbi:hypothetical protein DMA11_19355 [Marinilabiliaceae bacterium JC017]|nr:hypothetical protein DMA11_19355 [Marinilabiliaceae bacterium JC017]
MKKSFWMKGLFHRSLFAFAIVGLLFSTGCSDDDDDEKVESWAGNYKLKKAMLTSEIDLGGGIVIPANTDITELIEQALFSTIQCNDPDNTVIELREDKSLYVSCMGEDKTLQAGTWTEDIEEQTLTLNLNPQVVPPDGVSLVVHEVSVSGDTLSGKIIDMPMSKELIGSLLPPGVEIPGDAPDVFLVTFSIEFTKL